ncbi:endonuclease domain-containing protein [Microbacterium deminutum]|uniref:DUF559 domain-containing protein n=1 Tax=Microbacterium deminutum TaxID=344164 RepID=A0ABN2Q8I3_9MICO
MELHEWIDENGGIAHRRAADEAGFALRTRRAAVRDGLVERIRHNWLATASAPADLRTAAENSGRLACVSAARRRGWWMPEDIDERIHLRLDPNGASADKAVLAHWTRELAPAPGYGLVESVEDALAHIAVCLTSENARVVWESAIRVEGLSLEALRRVPWPTRAAAACAGAASGLSDSGLETIFVVKLEGWDVGIRQQVVIAGRRVDLLVGDRLVVQIDGYAHHSSSQQRTKDVALDAELVLRGYTVLRFTYAQVIHDWDSVERTMARAIAAGFHRAA